MIRRLPSGLCLGTFGAFGYILLGGYDLAVSRTANGIALTPNPVNPLSLLSFGISGAAIMVFCWLIIRGKQFPKGFGYLGYIPGVLLILFYVGRLVDDSLSNPLFLIPGVMSGIIVNPAWDIWLGLMLLRARKSLQGATAG
jgi:hypothetical protein